MTPIDSFLGFSGPDKTTYDCGMCGANNIDWSALTNTEKMDNGTFLKAQIIAELKANAPIKTGEL